MASGKRDPRIQLELIIKLDRKDDPIKLLAYIKMLYLTLLSSSSIFSQASVGESGVFKLLSTS